MESRGGDFDTPFEKGAQDGKGVAISTPFLKGELKGF
jgi:hypothetical protein